MKGKILMGGFAMGILKNIFNVENDEILFFIVVFLILFGGGHILKDGVEGWDNGTILFFIILFLLLFLGEERTEEIK